MEQVTAQAVPARNKERDEQLRRDINELLLKHLQGGTTIAEMEMIGDNVFALVDRWNQKGRIPGDPAITVWPRQALPEGKPK